jgi:hypothetical protein
MLQPGDRMPFFEIATRMGAAASYREHWQRRNVVLVVVPATATWNAYVERLERRGADIARHDAVLIITAEPIPGLPPASVAIADRWGELHYVAAAGPAPSAAAEASSLPDAGGILEWLEYIQHRCPECEGEAR